MGYAQPINFLDWRPDDDPRRPGVLVDVEGFFPTTKGMLASPSFVVTPTPFVQVDGVTPSLTGPVTGAISAMLASGEVVVVAGTAFGAGGSGHLYIYNVATMRWVEADGGHSFTGTGPWRFAVFSNNALGADDIIAVNGLDRNQVSRSGGTFAPMVDVATGDDSPVAKLVEVVDEGVFLANLTGNAHVPGGANEWIFTVNDQVWVPSVASGCVQDFLVGTPGPITAMHRLRGGIVMYKPSSMYMGFFVAPPNFWAFGSISENVGAATNEMVVNEGDLHLWPGPDNFYQFDGSSLQPIPNFVKEFFTSTVPEDDMARMRGEYLRVQGIARWYYPGTPGGVLDRSILYGVRAGQKWLRGNPLLGDGVGVAAIVLPNFSENSSLTYEQLGALYALYTDLPSVTYDNALFGRRIADVSGVLTTAGQLALEIGPPLGGFWTTGEIGDGFNYYQLTRVRVIYSDLPSGTVVRMQGYTRRLNGVTPTPTVNVLMRGDGATNIIQTGVSHTLKFIQVAAGEVTAVALDMKQVGLE